MKKILTSRVPLLLVIICFAILNCVFWPIAAPSLSASKATLWIGYGFLTGTFVIVALMTFIKVYNKNTVTSLAPIFLVTTGYLTLSAIINIIAMALNSENYIWALVTNFILLLLFVAAFLVANKHFARVNENTARRETRVRDWRMTAVDVSGLIAFSSDDEVTAALKKLKEDIEYSSSASSEKTKNVEEELDEQIITIKSMLKNNMDKETVLKAIHVAESILKNRNQILMVR